MTGSSPDTLGTGSFPGVVQGLLDTAVLTGFGALRGRLSGADLRAARNQAAAALELYQRLGWVEDPRLAHPDPGPPAAQDVFTRTFPGRRGYVELRFPSAYRPHPDDPTGPRWSAHAENHFVHAWVLQHRRPAPWLVLVHGAQMGRPRADMNVFKAAWLHRELGLNLAMPVLPLHGPRHSRVFKDGWPSDELTASVHGARQGVSDVRRTIAWIRAQQPGTDAPMPLGVHGISMGGYLAALVAGLETDLAAVIAGVPPSDLNLLLHQHGPPRTGPDSPVREEVYRLGRQLNPMISPLALEPLVAAGRRFVYAGATDRLVDLDTQARPLIRHWDARTLVYDGGHVGLGMGRRIPAFIAGALAETGLTGPA